ncbi:MAG: hypothetical protein CSB47_05070 [Proteobacteria bacterium]|nr:MAG: hypothetical protein CSB47_05070 [Pseudomonadota bacterium]
MSSSISLNSNMKLHPRSNIYQQQLKDHWYQRWIYLCQTTEIPYHGDYIAKNIGDYPLIIVRNQHDEINILNNSCRHRGSRICQKEKGNEANLVCPYHQWAYDLDGKLTYARNMMEEIDIANLPLKSFVCSIINGSVYVNLSLPADSDEQAPHECFTVKNRHRAAYQYRIQRNVGYEAVLSQLDLSLELLDTAEDASANARFYHDTETRGIIAADVIPIDEHHSELTLTYLVTSGTSEGKHFSRQDFITQSAKDLDIIIADDSITPLSVKPVRPVSAEDLPALNARQMQDILDKRQAIDHADVYAPYRIWDSSKQNLVCTMIVKETHNVRTYTFQIADGGWFNYKPGQFITLELPTEGEKTLRTYTLVSSPSRPMSISITIKAQPNSTGTRWIFDNVKVGDSLKAYGPNGDFSFFNDPADKYLFISAGSGITPMMSMTRWLYDYGGNMDVNFISCIASPDDILYQSELERMAGRSRDIQVSWVCENDNELNTWTGYRGRFNKLILGLAAPDYMDRDVYCCGPGPFMRAVREALDASGYDMQHYHEESFSGTETTPLPDDFPTEGRSVNITFSHSGKQHECDQRETILIAAKSANIAIPSACGFGVCGTCKVKVNSGETHMVHSGGISQKDIDAGYVLACCTNPMSDVEVEI